MRTYTRPETSYGFRNKRHDLPELYPRETCAVQEFPRNPPVPDRQRHRNLCANRSFSQALGSLEPKRHYERVKVEMDDFGLVGTVECSRHHKHTCPLKTHFYTAASIYYPLHRYRYWGQVKEPPPELKHDATGITEYRRLLPSVNPEEIVLFRSPVDGWYYEGMVTLDCKDYKYIVIDSNNHGEMVWRENIISNQDRNTEVIQEGDKVVVHHPDYRHSYVPCEVTGLQGNNVTVKICGQTIKKVHKQDVVTTIPERKYVVDVDLIKTNAATWINETVIARAKNGEYHIGKVVGLDDNDCAKFWVQWQQTSDHTGGNTEHDNVRDQQGSDDIQQTKRMNSEHQYSGTTGEKTMDNRQQTPDLENTKLNNQTAVADNNNAGPIHVEDNRQHIEQTSQTGDAAMTAIVNGEASCISHSGNQSRNIRDYNGGKSDGNHTESDFPEDEHIEAVHVFGALTPPRQMIKGDCVLAPTDSLCYLPGKVTETAQSQQDQNRMINIEFEHINIKPKRVRADENRCFWINESYYSNALAYYINSRM